VIVIAGELSRPVPSPGLMAVEGKMYGDVTGQYVSNIGCRWDVLVVGVKCTRGRLFGWQSVQQEGFGNGLGSAK
jgi:hypothetical protein